MAKLHDRRHRARRNQIKHLGPFASDQVGAWYTQFTPTQVGNYSFVFSWPAGQTLTNGTGAPEPAGIPYVGDYFEPSTSAPAILVVQQGAIPVWQNTPAPTGYWTIPVNSLNRDDWGTLPSNWLGGAWLYYNFQTEGQAPNSAHILWQTPIPDSPSGGILDAQWPTTDTNVRDYETPIGTSYGSSFSGASNNHGRKNLLPHCPNLVIA